MTPCPKCGYTRTEQDRAPEWQCPACGVAYVKVAPGAAAPVPRRRIPDPPPSRARLPLLLVFLFLAAGAFYLRHARNEAPPPAPPVRTARPAAPAPAVPAPAAPAQVPAGPAPAATEQAPPAAARPSRIRLFSDPAYAALDRDLAMLAPQRPGKIDLYFLGVGSYAEEDVFLKEVETVRGIFDARFDTRGRSLVMINNIHRRTDYPPATVDGLRRALIYLADLVDPEEDLVFVHLTSHGSSDHQLWFTSGTPLAGAPLQHLTPAMLRAYVDEAGPGYRAFSISACYSGGFIPRLADRRTFIVTAAHPEHKSFGCGNDSQITDFSQAYFVEALRDTHSFHEAFAQAENSIAVRERRQSVTPSLPQMYLGEAVKAKLDALQRQFVAGPAP
jgi:peptidase C13-like protein